MHVLNVSSVFVSILQVLYLNVLKMHRGVASASPCLQTYVACHLSRDSGPPQLLGGSHGSTPVDFLVWVRGSCERTRVRVLLQDADAGAASCWAGGGDAGCGALSGRGAAS
jgi:hypothetical protein